jgi:hypothetical protein
MTPIGFEDKVAFVWKVADKLRGTFKQHEYGSVMLPLLVPAAPGRRLGVDQGRGAGQGRRPPSPPGWGTSTRS